MVSTHQKPGANMKNTIHSSHLIIKIAILVIIVLTILLSVTGISSNSFLDNITFSDVISSVFVNPMRITVRPLSIPAGHGGPILIISSTFNPFSEYYSEILRTEGFNEFAENDIASVTYAMLERYDVVILGEMELTKNQVAMFRKWVKGGGHLIAMRPDKKLASLFGLIDLSSTIKDAYLVVNTFSGPGVGIVDQSIQYHGEADLYRLNGASSIATLCTNAMTQTSSPAVTLKSIGSMGGQAALFTYDLARSVVYTRQGNPAWAGQCRSGISPIRSNDLFCGNAYFDPKADWIDLQKVAIPQADEQQRLLANLIIHMNYHKKPLPRFWYFPRSLQAIVIMTGDDHGQGGTSGRFDKYMSMSPKGCSVENWECIRSTSYIFPDTPFNNITASAYNAAGFEVALHVNTNCSDWTPSQLKTFYINQFGEWGQKYSSLPLPVTNRTHCIAWSDYDTQPHVELAAGIGLDTNYYYWPPKWVANTPGFFTGSGMPMRFAASNGTQINVYQAVTQMTDESGQTFPFTIDTLLDRAIGREGYYGVFVANMHTDKAESEQSDAIIKSAISHGVPVISARQMLSWLDGRNASTFNSLVWSGNTLGFSIHVAQEARGLVAMAPMTKGHYVSGITRNGSSIFFKTTTIKGIRYAVFTAADGTYKINYSKGSAPVSYVIK